MFSVVFAVMSPAFVSQLKNNRISQLRMEAIQAANTIIDQKRLIDPTTMPSSGSDAAITVPVNNHNYSVVVSYCTVSTYCSSNTVRHLELTVSLNNENVFSTETVFTQLN
jgi:type II secretory pathway pseudopilin PulG